VVIWEEKPRRGFTYVSADMMDEIQLFAKREGIAVIISPILR
jgi:hypothetical protein